jgi:hypothetical protein
VLGCGFVFFLFVVPLTPVRLAKTSAELDGRLGLWRLLRADLYWDSHGAAPLDAVVAACMCFLAYGSAVVSPEGCLAHVASSSRLC